MVFSPSEKKLSYFAHMLEDLKLGGKYDGLIYLVESARNPPTIKSHHHVELELNLVVRGTISYVLGERRFTFGRRTLLWLFPSQEHQLVDRTSDAENYVAVFKQAEPYAYSYVDDDATSVFTCKGVCDYRITFGITP